MSASISTITPLRLLHCAKANPPEAAGRQLTLVASGTLLRILEGTAEIARHQRTYDRHQLVQDPAHQQALLKVKRRAFDATPTR
jgi:hypothetical protein